MSKVFEERAEIKAAMQADPALDLSQLHGQRNQAVWLSDSLSRINNRDALVERMRANVRKESVVRNLVGFYCINVFSMYQLAQVSLSCSPWFCMAWRVIGACEEKLAAQLAASSGDAGGGNNPAVAAGRSTRSSSRLAAQQEKA